MQKALLERLNTQNCALCKLKMITATQTTLLEDCFSAIDAVLGWVDNVLETYDTKLDGLRSQLPDPTTTRKDC
jgi:hypothetical protein